MSRDPMHTTVCDRCHRGTWYAEGTCRMSIPKRCDCCGSNIGEQPCGGTLRPIDRSGLVPAFAGYYESGERVRVEFCNADGKVYETLTGTIGKTTGWRPAYLLMRTANARGSSWVIGANDRVVAVKRGARYIPTVYA